MDDIVDTTLPQLKPGSSIWAIEPSALPRIVEATRSARTMPFSRLALQAAADAPKPRRLAARGAGSSVSSGVSVAVIPLTGIITPRPSFLSMLFGGSSGGLIGFRDAFREALNNPDIGAIVLDIDSPGGLIDLVPETAAEIRDARGVKPIVAVANTRSASAAYWIATQADELVVTPSGDVGSVGVYVVHENWSGFNEQAGIVPTYISAGKYKTEGNPDAPLSEEAQAAWQQEVDDLYALFVNDVAAGRGVAASAIRSGYGEGRTLLAQRALQAGMVDRVDTLEGVVGALLNPGATAGRAALAAGRLAIAVKPPAGATEENPAPETPEVEPAPDEQPPADHTPDDAPDDLPAPDPDPIKPDTGPDAEEQPADDPPAVPDPEARAALADVLFG